MRRKVLRRSLGLCLSLILALGSVSALGAGYGSIGLEKTNVSGDLFNGTGSFETDVASVGSTGDSNLSKGWKVYNGAATTDDFKVSDAQKTDGTHSVYLKSSKYICPDAGVVKSILDTNGVNGKYTINGNFYKADNVWNAALSYDFRPGTVTVSDVSNPTSFVSDKDQWAANGYVISPTNDNFPKNVLTNEELATLKPKNGTKFFVHARKSYSDTTTAPNAWYSLQLTFDGNNKGTWELWHSYRAYGYRNGKYYDKAGNTYETYAAAKASGNQPLIFNDKYSFEAGVINQLQTNVSFTELLVQGIRGVYIDGITMTFEPSEDVKASDFKGTTMPVITRVYNNAAEASNAVLITALYDSDNMLRGVATDDFSFAAGEADKIVSAGIAVPADLGEGYSVKTYAWKNLENDITPLATILDREAEDNNLLENGGFEILPKTSIGLSGDDSIAKNWKAWDGNKNEEYKVEGNGTGGSAYCVNVQGDTTYFEYSPDKMTEILKSKGVKGSYTLTFSYKYDNEDNANKYLTAMIRITSAYPEKSQTKYYKLEDTAGGWKTGTITFTTDKYETWLAGASEATYFTKDDIYNLNIEDLGGRLAFKAPANTKIDDISLTFTPDTAAN